MCEPGRAGRRRCRLLERVLWRTCFVRSGVGRMPAERTRPCRLLSRRGQQSIALEGETERWAFVRGSGMACQRWYSWPLPALIHRELELCRISTCELELCRISTCDQPISTSINLLSAEYQPTSTSINLPSTYINLPSTFVNPYLPRSTSIDQYQSAINLISTFHQSLSTVHQSTQGSPAGPPFLRLPSERQ